MFAFIVFVSVFQYLAKRLAGWEERLRNDLFCVEWDVKPQLKKLVDNKVKVIVAESAPQAKMHSVCVIRTTVQEMSPDTERHSLPTNVTASTSLSRDNLKHF